MDFKVDMEILEGIIITYESCIKQLNENLETLSISLQAINSSGWSGRAKEKFMSVKYGDWEKGMIGHILRFEYLVSILREGQAEFETIEIEGKSL